MRHVIASDLLKILGHGPGTFEIKPLPQDASMRRYFRIHGTELAGKRMIGETIILMVLADPNPRAKPEEITADGTESRTVKEPEETDLDYVNVLRHFESVGLPVPKLYLYNMEMGLLYLEDLGNNMLEDMVKRLSVEEIKSWYEKAIDIMLTIHQEATSAQNGRFVAFSRAFDEKLLFYELKHYVEYGIEARKKIKVGDSDLMVIEKHMRQISGELAGEPRVLSHRDFQSRNLMIDGQKLRIIDFQDALMGTRQYDMVSLLRDSYVVLRPEIIDHLIEYYVNRLEKLTGDRIDRAAFRRIFDLQTLQRKIKDAGRFDYIDIVKKNPKFLKYIPDTIGYVREAFDRLPEHRPLHEKLAKYTPELAG